MRPRAVFITGLGFISPIGHDEATVMDHLRHLRHGLTPVDWAPAAGIRVAGTIREFELSHANSGAWRWPAAYNIPRETLRGLSPHGVYALCAVSQAMDAARLPLSLLQDGNCGLFAASSGSPRYSVLNVNQILQSDGRRIPPWSVAQSISGTLNFNLGAHFGIKGAVTGFASGCTSSAHALGYAFDEIMLGRQERMIVVGAEEPMAETLLPFAGAKVTSRQSRPELASRPFDRACDGFVGAGGAAALILESAASLEARHREPLARMLGWGQSADGFKVAQPDITGSGLTRALRNALAASNRRADQIDYINAHATGTLAGDQAEARAIISEFGTQGPPVSSTKALTGHTLSMSGALEAALCVLSLQHGIVPGQAHLDEVAPACAALQLPRTTECRPIKTVISNSSAFGGSHVSIVLAKI